MLAQKKVAMTPGQYLAQERKSDTRSEYFNGEIFAMAGASREHNQISSNIIVSLGNQLRDKPCSVYGSDMRVKIAAIQKYTYPDISVSCDRQTFEDTNEDVLLNPILIVEVLSDSTEAYDRGLKFFHYQMLPSLLEFLLVSQKFCQVEKYARQKANEWIYSQFHETDDQIDLVSLDCKLALKEIFRRVELKGMQRPQEGPK